MHGIVKPKTETVKQLYRGIVLTKQKLMSPPCPHIDPDLKEFLDEVLVPMLVRDALKERSSEIRLASVSEEVRESAPTGKS